jgi:hypothetical protein
MNEEYIPAPDHTETEVNMDTTTNNSTAAPIAENEHVKELLSVMEANHMPGVEDLRGIVGQVTAIENHLADMVKELAVMRRELAEAQKNNHPIKTALQNAVITVQARVLDLRDKLGELKHNIIDGCKNALSAFKEKGLSALRNITEFLHIWPGLEAMRNSIDNSIKTDNAVIAKIETVSAEYHEAGRHIKNMGRAMLGKDAIQEARPSGMAAKTFSAPFRAARACNMAVRRCVTAAIGAVERLEKTERKPPIMETINKLNSRIEQAKRDAPTLERTRPVTHDGR